MSFIKTFIPYQQDKLWIVVNRWTGEVFSQPMPFEWAQQRAKQLNEGEKICKAQ